MPCYVIQNVQTLHYHGLYEYVPDLRRAFVFFTYPGADRNRRPGDTILRCDLDQDGRPKRGTLTTATVTN